MGERAPRPPKAPQASSADHSTATSQVILDGGPCSADASVTVAPGGNECSSVLNVQEFNSEKFISPIFTNLPSSLNSSSPLWVDLFNGLKFCLSTVYDVNRPNEAPLVYNSTPH